MEPKRIKRKAATMMKDNYDPYENEETWCNIKDLDCTDKAHFALKKAIEFLSVYEIPNCYDSRKIAIEKVKDLNDYDLARIQSCLRATWEHLFEAQADRSGNTVSYSMVYDPSEEEYD